MILAERAGQAGAAFINGSSGDGEPGEAFARTTRGLFGKISGEDGNNHKSIGQLNQDRIHLDKESPPNLKPANTLFLCTP